MSHNGHLDARTIRARLNHPIIDADGHWAEFHPHMRQEFKRIGGDIAVEAFDMATARIPKSLNMSVAERPASKDRARKRSGSCPRRTRSTGPPR